MSNRNWKQKNHTEINYYLKIYCYIFKQHRLNPSIIGDRKLRHEQKRILNILSKEATTVNNTFN